ncbi:MAG TPA: amidohydrolase family protein, partial [Flavisolibacter sp.]|nr:amidohydrolase family protein [Flavisolibacter sp.]
MARFVILYAMTVMGLSACKSTSPKVDLLLFNAKIYTVDSTFTLCEAMAVQDGRILETGTSDVLKGKYTSDQMIDAKGQFVYPGLIDAHAHFYRYGLGLQTADLTGTVSWQDILGRLLTFSADHQQGWLIGRGWDQNDWPVKEFPNKKALDSLFPTRPVLLTRVDGHAAIANQKALDLAGVKARQTLTGGEVETVNGQITGILIDNAVDLVGS